MQPVIENIFDEVETRHLSPDALTSFNQYVRSVPERLNTYRLLRDREISLMQKVADALEAKLPTETTERLEQGICRCILSLRHCAMAMLMNDEQYLADRLLGWLTESIQTQQTDHIDSLLHTLLLQSLGEILNPAQLKLLDPFLMQVQAAIGPAEEDDLLTVAAMF